jgi:hypothetical protein
MTFIPFDQDELQGATYASLRAHPISEQANALVSMLARMLDDHALAAGARKNKRNSTAEKLDYAVGAFLADLLRGYGDSEPEPNPWVYRSMHAKSFTGAAVSYRIFARIVDGLTKLGFILHVDGHKVSSEHRTKFAARFRATPALLAFCSDREVDPVKAHDHFEFEYDLPTEVVEKRATKRDEYWLKTKPVGTPMEFERDRFVTIIEDKVKELNEFFAQQKLRGGSHHGYVRVYNNGDNPRFHWNMGGRLYSQHFTESYQVMSGEERLKMTINGEPVAEIDIRASYLTIFLSLHDIQLPEGDPYDLPGLGPEHRNAAKQWMVGTFGNSKPIVRWPPRMLQKMPELSQHKVSTITKAALTKYPALSAWGQPLRGVTHSWADLMWIESNGMLGTMLKLKQEHQIPSLSVHDSLLVPARSAETAQAVLKQQFQYQRGITPLLKVNWSKTPTSQPEGPEEPEHTKEAIKGESRVG